MAGSQQPWVGKRGARDQELPGSSLHTQEIIGKLYFEQLGKASLQKSMVISVIRCKQPQKGKWLGSEFTDNLIDIRMVGPEITLLPNSKCPIVLTPRFHSLTLPSLWVSSGFSRSPPERSIASDSSLSASQMQLDLPGPKTLQVHMQLSSWGFTV